MMQALAQEPPVILPQVSCELEKIAAYLRVNCATDISLGRLCQQSGYNAGISGNACGRC